MKDKVLPTTTTARRLGDLQRELESRAAAMSAEDTRPRQDGKWSVAEILEHLYLTYTGTIKGLNRVLEVGKPVARRPSVKDRVRTFVVTGLGYFPEGRKAPAVTAPRALDVAMVRTQIGGQIAAMNDLLTQCATRFGGGTRLLDHPVLGPLTADQWRKFHLVHGEHHLKQIEQRWSARRSPSSTRTP
jgi:Protein of unknown function (DUF1569)